MWLALGIAAQLLTCVIALGLLWKDWKELERHHSILPYVVLVATLLLTVVSTALMVKGVRDADRIEAAHKGEGKQFSSTLETLLDRIGTLQKQVNTEPLLQQNKQLQQDLSDTKKLVQATKDQVGKPAPKATLEATFSTMVQDASRIKETTVSQEQDGSVEFKFFVMNTSTVQAKKGKLYVRICTSCKFVNEPANSVKAVDGYEYDREIPFRDLDVGVGIATIVRVMPPLDTPRQFDVGVASRCENCRVRPTDKLVVHY